MQNFCPFFSLIYFKARKPKHGRKYKTRVKQHLITQQECTLCIYLLSFTDFLSVSSKENIHTWPIGDVFIIGLLRIWTSSFLPKSVHGTSMQGVSFCVPTCTQTCCLPFLLLLIIAQIYQDLVDYVMNANTYFVKCTSVGAEEMAP